MTISKKNGNGVKKRKRTLKTLKLYTYIFGGCFIIASMVSLIVRDF